LHIRLCNLCAAAAAVGPVWRDWGVDPAWRDWGVPQDPAWRIGELLKIQPGEIGELRTTQPGWIGKLHILCQMKTGINFWTRGSTVATTKTIQSNGGQFEADSGLLRKASAPG